MATRPEIEERPDSAGRPGQDPVRDYEIARDAAKAAREAAREAVSPEARFFLKKHADLLERIAATRQRALAGRTMRIPMASVGSTAAMAIFG
jgi:hypothetical protein